MNDVYHQHKQYIRKTFELARKSLLKGGEPFGSLLVLNEEIVASTLDKSIVYSDPTAHAELILISEYCREERIISLKEYTLYTNAEPCIMCSGAIHWAKISKVVFGISQDTLQSFSGGHPKPGCREFINSGGKKVEIIGPILEDEGKAIFENIAWKSKKKRHEAYWKEKKREE